MFLLPLEPFDQLIGHEDKALRNLIEGIDPDREDPDDRYAMIENLIATIVPMLEKLPPREADIWQMYYLMRKRQADIADLMGVTQASVSYTAKKASERLRFLWEIEKLNLTDQEILATLASTPLAQIDLDILMTYRETTQQSRTATIMGLTQGRVRHRLTKACKKLEDWAVTRPELQRVSKLFSALRDNCNILAEINSHHAQRREQKGTTLVDDRWAHEPTQPKPRAQTRRKRQSR